MTTNALRAIECDPPADPPPESPGDQYPGIDYEEE